MIRAGSKLRGPQLYTPIDQEAASRAASCARLILDSLIAELAPGVRPTDIERACAERIEGAGGRATMCQVLSACGKPFGASCSVSIDQVVAHARPIREPLQRGQLVTIDLMLSLDGWHADVADTIVVGGGGHLLLDALDAIWDEALGVIQPGDSWDRVTDAMARAGAAHRARLVRGLAGHGIGLAPHELPMLPLTPLPGEAAPTLRPGMVITLEPAITSGTGETVDSEDGWAIRTADGAPVVGREAMIVIERDGVHVLGGPTPDDSVIA